MEKKKILLDNNGIDLVCENFDLIYSKRENFEFFICHTVFEEFTNGIDLINKKDRFILDKSVTSQYNNLKIEQILLELLDIDNEEDLVSEIKKFNKTKLKEQLLEFLDRKRRFKSNLKCIIKLAPKIILDGVFILGHSKLGTAKFSKGDLYYKLENRTCKNTNDSIIAETTVNGNCELLTNDKGLKERMEKAGAYKTISIEELLLLCE